MKIEDLGEKVEELERLLGYSFHKEHFDDATIRAALQVATAAQWARKKAGVAAVHAHELSKLFVHFHLPGTVLTSHIFEESMDDFRQALKDARVGTHGLADGHCVRQAWLNDPKCKHGGITCRPADGKRGGFGVAQDDRERTVRRRRFRIGERATIQIAVPDDGHILLLNDQIPIGETTCLMPSLFASTTKVKAGLLDIPRKEDSTDALTVTGPPGWYRLFAIWTRETLAVEPRLVDTITEDQTQRPQIGPPHQVSLTDFVDIQADLQNASRKGPYAILTTTYEVVARG